MVVFAFGVTVFIGVRGFFGGRFGRFGRGVLVAAHKKGREAHAQTAHHERKS